MPSKLDVKCKGCPQLIARQSRSGMCQKCYAAHRAAAVPGNQVNADREKRSAAEALNLLKRKYDDAVKTIDRQEREIGVLDSLVSKGIDTFKIEPREGSGQSEATAVVLWSDWHHEERVKPGSISGLNEHGVDISKKRAVRLFESTLRLIRLLQQDTHIDNALIPLLGDFISNDIHDEFPEVNELTPMLALESVQNLLASGIEFLLAHSKLNLTFPCHSGNHARTTKTTRFATENGHSLEYLMYRHLAAYFRHEPRVTFIIPEGAHSYIDVYGTTIRAQHGHMIKYGGGVGGIYIPVNKAIAQWNKARHADLDVFGHFHQCKDGGNFICNGSLIGYNTFALSIKADFEAPKQQLFLMDKKRGRTCTWPIMVK